MRRLIKSFPRKATAGMKKKTLITIFLRFFVLTLLLMVSSIMIAAYSNYRMIDDAKEANHNYLRVVSSSLDGLFNKIKDKGYSISSDSNYLNLISMTDKSQKNYASSTYALSSKLYDLYISDDTVDDAFIYFQNIDTVLAGSGSYETAFYLNKYYRYKGYSQPFWNGEIEKGVVSTIFPATDVYRQTGVTGEKKYKTIVPLVLGIENIAHARSYMIVNIDEQKIYQMIDNMNITKKGDIYLVDTLHNRLISATNRKMLGGTFNLGELHLNVKDVKIDSKASIEGDNYLLSFQPSSWNNIGFLIVTPEKMLTGPINKFLYMTIGVIALFMLIGTIVSAVFTFGIYSPLAEMVNYVKRFAKAPFENGKSEYDYIKENITTLQQFQQESLPSLLQIFLYRALNQQLNQEDIERLQQKYDFFRDGGLFALAVVRVGLAGGGELAVAEHKRQLITLNKPVLDMTENESVLFLQEQDAGDVDAFVMKLEADLTRYQADCGVEISLAVGVSSIFVQLDQTWKAYKDACTILDVRSVSSGGIIFGVTDSNLGGGGALNVADKKETMRKYLENGHVEGAAQLLDQIFEGAKKQQMPFKAFRQLVSDLLYFAVETVYSRRIDEESMFGMPAGEMIARVNTMQSPLPIEALCRNVYGKVTAHVQTLQQSSQALTGMLDYITANLAEVNLTTIADRFDLNANYVSQYFKKHKGVTFTDYINHLRIEKAKELLLGTDCTAIDIGKQIGFNNANAFIRMFKKLEGTTPHEYRKGVKANYSCEAEGGIGLAE